MNPVERELAAISERALNIYQGVLFEDSIRLLAGQKEQADPDWLAARVENMLLSNNTALARMQALYKKADTLLEQYRRLPEADPLKLTCFEMSGLLTVKRQAEQLEENGKRFTQLLKAIREAKKQRGSVSLAQLMKRISG